MKPTIAASVAVSGVLRAPAIRFINITAAVSLLSTRPFRSSSGCDTRYDQDDQRRAQARRYTCASVGSSSRVLGGSFAWPQNQHPIVAISSTYFCAGKGFYGTAASSGPSTIRFRQTQRRSLTFSFAGPLKLDELIKKESLKGKTGTEIADIWYTYHEEKVSNSTDALKCSSVEIYFPALLHD
jgi:hypothetical protein